MIETLQLINAGVAFFLELVTLTALGYWGFYGEKSLLAKWTLGIGLPFLTAVVWGMFLLAPSCSKGSASAGEYQCQSSFVDSILVCR